MPVIVVGVPLTGIPSDAATPLRDEFETCPVFVRDSSLRDSLSLDATRKVVSFDEELSRDLRVSETAKSFVDSVRAAAASNRVVYLTSGNPLTDDALVRLMRMWAEIEVLAIGSPGVADTFLPAIPVIDLAPGLQIVDALDLAIWTESAPFAGGEPPLSPSRPAVITNLVHPILKEPTRIALERLYPGDATAYVLSGREVEVGTLAGLAQPVDRQVKAAYLPRVDPLLSGRTSDALAWIVAKLRAPGGCPWDRDQTHQTLSQAAIEEAYEVVDAIERGDLIDMQEELGDLLLQSYMHAQLAEEAGEFTLEDVFEAVTAKLVRRHPHVFGDVAAASAGEVLRNWDAIKRTERSERGDADDAHPLGKIPISLPALSRAQTVLRRAQRAGLIELSEDDTRAFIRRLSDGEADLNAIADALLGVVYLAQAADVEAEEALRRRVAQIEDAIRAARSSPATRSAATRSEERDQPKGDEAE